jgi:hypothetical protein
MLTSFRFNTSIEFNFISTVSASLYGSKNCVLTEEDKNRIQVAEMRFLRATLGVTRQDELTNKANRKT